MENIKNEIVRWFNGPQDYNEGLRLLEKVSKKNKVISKLVRKGSTRSSVEKLTWELNKIAGLKTIPQARKPVYIKSKIPVIKVAKQDPEQEPNIIFNLIGKNDIDDYPSAVRRLVREYSGKYMLRGKKHAELRRITEDNDPETVAKRKNLIDDIRVISDRLEMLYEAFKAYEDSGSVDVESVWPEDFKKPEAPKKKLSVDELKILKKNIQSSITKDRNLLLYGKKTKDKDGKENPMPDGPRRTRLEKRVAKKEAEILSLDQQIAELE